MLMNRKSEKLLNAMGNLNDSLITEAAPPARQTRSPRRRIWAAAAVAAVLLMSGVCASASLGGFQGLADLFAPPFREYRYQGELNTELMERLGQPVGESVTANGVTVAVDSVLRDRYVCMALVSIRMEGIEAVDWENALDFHWLTAGGCLEDHCGSGWRFADLQPGDDTIQCAISWYSSEGFPEGRASFRFESLSLDYPSGEEEEEPNWVTVAEGPWELEFDAPCQDLAVSLPAGQRVQVEEVPLTVDAVTFSPLGLKVEYTAETAGADLGRELLEVREGMPPFSTTLRGRIRSLDVRVSTKDGAEDGLYLAAAGFVSSITDDQREEGETLKGSQTLFFDWPIPLEDVAAITVEGVEIPLVP